MSLPFGHADTTFESFLQELPEDYQELAREFKAFCRSRKIGRCQGSCRVSHGRYFELQPS